MSTPPSSILHTATVPAFDPDTRQLSTASHHLLSIPLSYLGRLPASCTFSFERPPTQPYQKSPDADNADRTEAASTSRRKRRRIERSAVDCTAADFVLSRHKQEQRSSTVKDADAHHSEIVMQLEVAIEAVRAGWKETGAEDWLGRVGSRVTWIEKDHTRREALDLVGMARQCGESETKSNSTLLVAYETTALSSAQLCRSLVANMSLKDARLSVTHEGADYPFTLPPSSAFRMSTFDTWPTTLSRDASHLGCPWDILVLDPPWPNASATRSSSYDTFDPYALGKLNLRSMLGNTPCLVAVWVTNRVKYRRLVIDKLFPSWGVTGAVEWYWVKITSHGDPVWSVDSSHRRCYEGLIVGRYTGGQRSLPPLPRDKVFLACPVGHSRKPVLLDLLQPHLPPMTRPPNVMELFARMTLGGPTSMTMADAREVQGDEGVGGMFLAVGNEPIKFNAV